MTHDIERIAPRSGTAFRLKKGQYLTVIDPDGQQVADLLCYNANDMAEHISSGRTIDYTSRIFLTTNDVLYSNRSRHMMKIMCDDVGRHDFILTPCSKDTFRIIYGEETPHHGCQGNFEMALEPHGVSPDNIPVAFNVFMHTDVNGDTGEIKVLPPKSRAGDSLTLRAEMDLIVAMTACSAGQSNNYKYGPIDYFIHDEFEK